VRERKRQKKESILAAATKVFATCGFYNAKMAKIAELAGVGAGSIYLYYKNKQHLLDEILNKFWKGLNESIDKISELADVDIDEQMVRVIDVLFDTLVEDSSIAMIFIHENSLDLWNNKVETNQYFERFFATAESMIRKGQQTGYFLTELDASLALHFVSGGIRELLHEWANAKNPLPLELLKKNIQILSRQGLLHPNFLDNRAK
jgi:TetR/AcrR family transcriptional regulator, fatty acid metabolism regulator protein